MKINYQPNELLVLYFHIFTGTSIEIMDTHLLIKRIDALRQS